VKISDVLYSTSNSLLRLGRACGPVLYLLLNHASDLAFMGASTARRKGW
jgi:hypothetical protein